MEKDIGKIKKNEMTDIVIRIDDFGGRPGLTIREFATSDRYTGFTKSGTRIPAESFADFKAMINSIGEGDFPASAVAEEAKSSDAGASKGSEQNASNGSSESSEEKTSEIPSFEDV